MFHNYYTDGNQIRCRLNYLLGSNLYTSKGLAISHDASAQLSNCTFANNSAKGTENEGYGGRFISLETAVT